MNYLIRKNNIQKVYLTENTLDVMEILSENYDYIADSMNREGFSIISPVCSLFKELVYDTKVVGFCSYDYSRQFMTSALNNIYVLPEFRGKGLFLEELTKTMKEHNKPSIVEPTRLVVELLVKYGFAKRITDSIVACSFEFIIPGEQVLSNVDYDSSEELATHFYDLKICASIHFLDLEKSHFAYSSPLNYDIDHYDCLDMRNQIDDDYLNNLKELFINQDENLINTVMELEDNLSVKSYTLEEIIGEGDELSPYIESLIDDAHVTHQKALEIKNQIREEYEAGMILNESLLIRLAYLFDVPDEPSIKSHTDVCPYCSMPIDDHDRFCHFCGINLRYNPNEMFDSLVSSIKTHDDDFQEDIRYVAYKFLKLIDGGIDFDYAVLNTENTYNVNWDVLKGFLDENNYFNGTITDDGYEFMHNHPLNYYEEFNLSFVDYNDFEKYFYEHDDLNGIEICLNYLKQLDDDSDVLETIEELKKYI
ncbi:GNAT family N-acetyltransferase [uncultured Methanobrevibacter sp.]|uniref:GNAT family N-acetyltransferase n=1 Tax=uncultured Methanobrevibacter sp. TaxID=253161 RepID=UPI0025D42751|nr:GNAT family N-acetyltransferase [uncultured Methanobrevibacter sp.]